MDRVRLFAPSGLAVWILLGQQGARFGSFIVPETSWRWLLAAAVIVYFTSPQRDDVRLGRREVALALVLAVSFAGLTLWRHRALAAPLGVTVTIDGERSVVAPTLDLERRRDLRRLTGKRRAVAVELSAVIEVPVDGDYDVELDCDDGCRLEMGDHAFVESATLRLAKGEHRIVLRYHQLGGPAHLRWGWDSPRAVELLPLEFFIRAEGAPSRSSARGSANASLALLSTWWLATFGLLRHLSRQRIQIRSRRWIPLSATILILGYGCFLRAAAVQIHSGRGGSEALAPWVPGYSVFNEDTAPEDPYRADVRSYLDRLESFSWLGFYRPSFREPFYIALCAPFVWLLGSEIGILVQSAFFSCAGLILFWGIARKLYGWWWALSLLVPVALHEWLIAEAPSGYRMSAYSFFLLAFIGATFIWTGTRTRGLVAGTLAAALCLIRLSALSFVVPLLALKLWSMPSDQRLRYGALSAVALAALVLPFLIANGVAHHDPFYSISFHTEFWLRAEGLDTSQGSVPWTRYFTDFGRGAALIRGHVVGMTTLPVGTFWNGLRHFPIVGLVTVGLGLMGLVRALTGPSRFLTAAYLCHLIPFAYIQNFPSGEMPRFVMPSFFFLVLAAPWALGRVLTLVKPRATVNA